MQVWIALNHVDEWWRVVADRISVEDGEYGEDDDRRSAPDSEEVEETIEVAIACGEK